MIRDLRVLVTGSRTWQNSALIRAVLVDIHHSSSSIVDLGRIRLVSGHCPDGADFIAEGIAEGLDWSIEKHPALWHVHGKRAGYVRNEEMVASTPNLCVAFWDGVSRGTKHTMDLCERYGVALYTYRSDEEDGWLMPSGRFLTSRVGL